MPRARSADAQKKIYLPSTAMELRFGALGTLLCILLDELDKLFVVRVQVGSYLSTGKPGIMIQDGPLPVIIKWSYKWSYNPYKWPYN